MVINPFFLIVSKVLVLTPLLLESDADPLEVPPPLQADMDSMAAAARQTAKNFTDFFMVLSLFYSISFFSQN